MKKIAFMFVVAAMFAACGGQKAETPAVEAAPADSLTEVATDSVADSTAVADSTVAVADSAAAQQ